MKTFVKNGYGKELDELIQYHNKENWDDKVDNNKWDLKHNEIDANDDEDDCVTQHINDCVALHIEHTHIVHPLRARIMNVHSVSFLLHISSTLTLAQVRALSALHSRPSTCHPCVRSLHLELRSLLLSLPLVLVPLPFPFPQ